MTEKVIRIYPRDEGVEIASRRVCSDCYGSIDIRLNYLTLEVQLSCSTPACEFRGTISKATLKIRLERDRQQYQMAKEALASVAPEIFGPPPKQLDSSETKTLDEIIQDLYG